MITLLAAVLEAGVVLAVGLGATIALGRRSAALRHAILAAAIVTAMVMPALKLVLPQIPVIPRGESARVVSSGVALASGDTASQWAVSGMVAAGRAFPWATVFLVIWIAGAIAICAGVVTALVRVSRLRARCGPVAGRWRELADVLARECGIHRPVLLLQSDDAALLVTCGVLNPCIILPSGAAAWPDDRCRSVIRHELAHIARHDAAVQVAGEALRVVQWINPLAWIACRHLRRESEYACDDAVLSGGVEPTEYATHLLDVARHLSGRPPSWVSAPAIAEPSTLERRIVAMLHERRNRAPLGRRGWLITALVALGIGVPLGAAGVAPVQAPALSSARDVALPAPDPRPTPPARPSVSPRPRTDIRPQATGTIAGNIFDQLGGTLPGVTVALSDPRSGALLTTQTDAAGAFAFRAVQPAEYELDASLPGFMAFMNTVTVAAGSTVDRPITLPLGALQETLTISCSASAPLARLRSLAASLADGIVPTLSAHESGAQVRVGGMVRQPMKTHDVKPVCPSTVPQGETALRLVGHIGVEGRIVDATLAETQPGGVPPGPLVDSTLEAVRQWAFTPALLDGQPVEVIISVNVTFTR